MDQSRNIADEYYALGCKVTHDIIRPNMCVVGNEVGANISMKCDGHAGGELMLCERGTIPQQKVPTQNKHFILMSLTLLPGEPLMCILIISDSKPLAATEMGIDQLKDMVDKGTDEDFIENNYEKGKLCPGRLTCIVKGVEAPCFI